MGSILLNPVPRSSKPDSIPYSSNPLDAPDGRV
jgi:hypothetical protein